MLNLGVNSLSPVRRILSRHFKFTFTGISFLPLFCPSPPSCSLLGCLQSLKAECDGCENKDVLDSGSLCLHHILLMAVDYIYAT
jgi:hypothetical protein